jgi:hypothetical protein
VRRFRPHRYIQIHSHPDYCNLEIKETVEFLSGYETKDWAKLGMDRNVFILKYASVSTTLVQKSSLLPLDRVGRFLIGFSEKLRECALRFCARKSWRLSSYDTRTEESDYKGWRKFIETRAEAAQKKMVYGFEYARRSGSVSTVTTASPSVRPVTIDGIYPGLVSTSTPSMAIPSAPVAQAAASWQRLSGERLVERVLVCVSCYLTTTLGIQTDFLLAGYCTNAIAFIQQSLQKKHIQPTVLGVWRVTSGVFRMDYGREYSMVLDASPACEEGTRSVTISSQHSGWASEDVAECGGAKPVLRARGDVVARYSVRLLLAGQIPWADASSISDPTKSTGLAYVFGTAAYLVLLALGLLAFNATKARRCMFGGLSMFGMLFLPCAAFLDLEIVWCSASFSLRDFTQEERLIPEGMRDLHPAGGGASKRRIVWKYDGPHGTGDVKLFRLVEEPGEVWERQEFIAPAAAWVFYLDELHDEATMNAETCVIQLYRSLWIYNVGFCVGLFSMGIGMLIAWMSSASLEIRLVGMCLAVLRALVILWRWTADLFMSNHHRGALLRQGNLPEAPMTSCKDYRRSHELDAFSRARLPQSLGQTPGAQVKALLRTASRKTARLFQSWWLDWCAGHFEVHHPNGGPTVKLDVRVGDKSHIATVPEYIADGLSQRTIQPGGLAWLSIFVTFVYAGLVGTQMVLFALRGMSVVSASLWGGVHSSRNRGHRMA